MSLYPAQGVQRDAPGRRSADGRDAGALLTEVTSVDRRSAAPPPRSPRWLRRYQATVLTADLVAGTAVAAVVHLVAAVHEPGTTDEVVTVGLPLFWVLAVGLARGYARGELGTGTEEFRSICRAAVLVFVAAAVGAYLLDLRPPRTLLAVALPMVCLTSLVLRHRARRHLHTLRGRGRCLRSVVVVGREAAVLDLVRQLRADPHYGMAVVGACVPDPASADRLRAVGVEEIADLASAAALVRRLGAERVAVTSSSETAAQYLRRLCWQLEGSRVELLVAPGLMEVAGPRLHVRPFVGLPLLQIEQPEFTGSRRVVKEAIDRVAAALGLLALSPLLLVIAVCAALDTPGPVFFRQVRVGRGGVPFTIVKFRTMHVDAERQRVALVSVNEGAGALFKLREDPRVTRVGRLLRRYSLDELPQLVNVLAGTMSLVGPRPPLPAEVSQYEDDTQRRLLVKPGLTGLWQVSGRSDLSWEDSVRLDLRYVENWTLVLDVLILWKTIATVVRPRGAY